MTAAAAKSEVRMRRKEDEMRSIFLLAWSANAWDVRGSVLFKTVEREIFYL